jgi:ABC-type spermidine/putrescine transport system permease subunit II
VRRIRHPVATTFALLGLSFLWVPLVVVLVNSFNQDTVMSGWGGFTGSWYRQAFNDEAVRAGLRTTIVVALLSTLLSVVLAVTAVLWWRRAPVAARRVFDAFVYARIILPEAVFAIALFFFFNRIGFSLGLTAIVIGHTVWNSAYATLIIQARMVGLDPALDEAAADLGATPWRAFRRVTLALLLPGIIAAALLSFTFSFDDIVTSYFMAGSAHPPLPIVLFGMIRFKITPEINAIGVLIMLFTITLLTSAVLSLAAAGSVGRRARTGVLSLYGQDR